MTDIDEIVAQFTPWINAHRRVAWRPVTVMGDGSLTDSKFSGLPWLAAAEKWPVCKICSQPMQLFLQLNLAQLPHTLAGQFGNGLLQLFYCTRYDCDANEAWEPFSEKASHVRLVDPMGPTLVRNNPDIPNYFPAKTIVDWKPINDAPHPTEHELLGLIYDYDFDRDLVTVRCDALSVQATFPDDLEIETKIGISQDGDKLGGWPFWVQYPEYPTCPRCEKHMISVFQLDSEDNLPFMFGDTGVGHITQCPDHKDVVAFGWACY